MGFLDVLTGLMRERFWVPEIGFLFLPLAVTTSVYFARILHLASAGSLDPEVMGQTQHLLPCLVSGQLSDDSVFAAGL